MNGRPFYELEGGGEDVYLYYYHDGKKNRYWLISKYVRIDKKFEIFRNFSKIFKNFHFTNCLFLSRLMFCPCSDIVLKN